MSDIILVGADDDLDLMSEDEAKEGKEQSLRKIFMLPMFYQSRYKGMSHISSAVLVLNAYFKTSNTSPIFLPNSVNINGCPKSSKLLLPNPTDPP